MKSESEKTQYNVVDIIKSLRPYRGAIIVFILIPIISNWLISWNSSLTVEITNENQLAWLSFYGTWFSGVAASLIGGFVAYKIAERQFDKANEVNRNRELREERRALASQVFVDLRVVKQAIFALAMDIYNHLSTIYDSMDDAKYVFDVQTYNQYKQENYIRSKSINDIYVVNSYMFSDFHSKKITEVILDDIIDLHSIIFREWNSYCIRIKAGLDNGSRSDVDEVYKELNESLIDKLNTVREQIVEYESQYINEYMSELLTTGNISPVKFHRIEKSSLEKMYMSQIKK